MATLLIRNLEDSLKESLRVRAAQHGRSMEAEARAIIQEGVSKEEPQENLYVTVRRAVAKYGGGDLNLPPREQGPEPIEFD